MSGQKKIVITVTPELDAALEGMRDATRRPDQPEVVRDALNFYETVIQMVSRGERVFIGPARDDSAEVQLPHLDHARNYRKLRIVRDDEET